MDRDAFEIEICAVRRETERAVTLEFVRCDGSNLNYQAGQYITLSLPIDGQVQKRCYSFSSSPQTAANPQITVKEIADGFVSRHINCNIKPGDRITAEGPDGRFTNRAMPHLQRRFVMIGGGSGVTPLLSLAESILETEPEATIDFFYGNRGWDDIIFRDRINRLATDHDRFQVTHILEDGDERGDAAGRIDAAFIKQHIKAVRKKIFYVCGPGPMMDGVEAALTAMGAQASQINLERFASDIPVPEDLPDTEAVVYFAASDVEIAVTPGETILDAALAAGLPLKYRCSLGDCATCKVKCLSGQVKLPDNHCLTQAELDDDYILTCCGYPADARVELDA